MDGQLWVSLNSDLAGPFSLENLYVSIFIVLPFDVVRFCRLFSLLLGANVPRTKGRKMAG